VLGDGDQLHAASLICSWKTLRMAT
jgi:hypothetical protein